MSIELQTLKSVHITHLFDFSYFTVLVFYKIDYEQLLRVYRRGNYAFIGCPADAKQTMAVHTPGCVQLRRRTYEEIEAKSSRKMASPNLADTRNDARPQEATRFISASGILRPNPS